MLGFSSIGLAACKTLASDRICALRRTNTQEIHQGIVTHQAGEGGGYGYIRARRGSRGLVDTHFFESSFSMSASSAAARAPAGFLTAMYAVVAAIKNADTASGAMIAVFQVLTWWMCSRS